MLNSLCQEVLFIQHKSLVLFIGSVPHIELEDLAALFELPLEGNDQVIFHFFLSQGNVQVKKVAFELFKGDEHFLELEAG